MKTLHQSLLLALGALALAGMAYGQQPPDMVASDQYNNTAMGSSALQSLMAGFSANGHDNTASGALALNSDTTGSNNTASGAAALEANKTGSNNTASGAGALEINFAGDDNTASGFNALGYNVSGNGNTASGYYALYGTPFSETHPDGSTGSNNTAIGANALYSYLTGGDNTASGASALYSNTTGNYNTASGMQALYANKTGAGNTTTGFNALYHNTDGHYNTAEGYKAGYNLTTGSYNIDIGNVGVAAESGIIRIGTSGQQTEAFIAGIENTQVTGSAVYVTSAGQLGVLASSERFKTAIAPMGSDTSKLGQLRPVTFKVKSDSTGTRQYGLIAEEVAKVYPELVIRNEKGRISGVRYDELAPMLLNEMQKRNAAQDEHIAAQDAKINQLTAQLAEMHAAFERQRKDEVVAQR